MTNRQRFGTPNRVAASVLLAAVVIVIVLWGRLTHVAAPASDGGQTPANLGVQHGAAPSSSPDGGAIWGVPATKLPADTRSPLDTVAPPVFRATPAGKLVVDQQARVDVERLYALHSGPQLLYKLDEYSQHLPVQARQELRNLLQHYVQYDAAMAQALAGLHPNDQPTIDSVDKELSLLHELRQTYFGDDAQAMFGAEEAASREMHDYIRNKTDPNLPLSQRAELAQAAWLEAHGPELK